MFHLWKSLGVGMVNELAETTNKTKMKQPKPTYMFKKVSGASKIYITVIFRSHYAKNPLFHHSIDRCPKRFLSTARR